MKIAKYEATPQGNSIISGHTPVKIAKYEATPQGKSIIWALAPSK